MCLENTAANRVFESILRICITTGEVHQTVGFDMHKHFSDCQDSLHTNGTRLHGKRIQVIP